MRSQNVGWALGQRDLDRVGGDVDEVHAYVP